MRISDWSSDVCSSDLVIEQLLSKQGHNSAKCESVGHLASELERGAGTAVVTEESMTDADHEPLWRWLGEQEAWSDFPFILLATKRARSEERRVGKEGVSTC